MAWMYQFWRHQHREAQHRLRRELLPSLTQRPRFARLCVGDAEVEVPTDRLHAGDRIVVEEGEMVPADGWLAGGFAVVDERLVRGVAGLTRKEAGDPVFAGSFAIEGRLYRRGLGARRGHPSGAARPRAGRRHRAGAGRIRPDGPGRGVRAPGRRPDARRRRVRAGRRRPDHRRGHPPARLRHRAGPGRFDGVGPRRRRLRARRRPGPRGLGLPPDRVGRRLPLRPSPRASSRPAWRCARSSCCDGVDEDDVLRLAASAFAGLADDRSAALNAACASRRLIVRRDLRPSYRGPEITLRDRDRSVTIRDVPEAGPPGDRCPAWRSRPTSGPSAGSPSGDRPVPRAAEAIRELRRQGPLTIGLVSDRPAAEAASLAAALDMDFHVGGLSSEARAVAVRSLRERGLKVAYVGDCRREPDAAREAHVAISLADDLDLADDPAQVLVLRPGLDWVAGLRERSRSHVGCIRTVHGFVLVPNLFCIAGAFFLGFTSLSAVVLTNLGTLAVYSGLPRRRGLRALPSLARGGHS